MGGFARALTVVPRRGGGGYKVALADRRFELRSNALVLRLREDGAPKFVIGDMGLD